MKSCRQKRCKISCTGIAVKLSCSRATARLSQSPSRLRSSGRAAEEQCHALVQLLGRALTIVYHVGVGLVLGIRAILHSLLKGGLVSVQFYGMELAAGNALGRSH